jgi:hypothetical protein
MKGEQRQSTLEESYESLMVREIYGSLLQKNKRERAMKNSAQIKKKSETGHFIENTCPFVFSSLIHWIDLMANI